MVPAKFVPTVENLLIEVPLAYTTAKAELTLTSTFRSTFL